MLLLQPTAAFAHRISRYSVNSFRHCNAVGPSPSLKSTAIPSHTSQHLWLMITDMFLYNKRETGWEWQAVITYTVLFIAPLSLRAVCAPTRWLLVSTCHSGRICWYETCGHQEAVVERRCCVSTSSMCSVDREDTIEAAVQYKDLKKKKGGPSWNWYLKLVTSILEEL